MSTSSTGTPTATSSRWQIDPSHTLAEFSVRHMMFTNVRGRFNAVKGTIVDVADDPTRSSVEVEIDPSTIVTGDEKRDTHLRSADFFDVEKFPAITFKSTRIEGSRENFSMTGDLTIHGITRPVTLDVTYNGEGTSPWGKTVAGFTAEGKLNRKDYDLNWNVALESGGWLVSDQIKLTLEIEAIKED
jgi:polyisoprenoid-binding protein YceI